MDEIQQQLPAAEQQKALEERLKRIEEESAKPPELPPDVVSAGSFPGSIRIPRTDAAVKFGGRIRTAGVWTLDALGSEDRFFRGLVVGILSAVQVVKDQLRESGSRPRYHAAVLLAVHWLFPAFNH